MPRRRELKVRLYWWSDETGFRIQVRRGDEVLHDESHGNCAEDAHTYIDPRWVERAVPASEIADWAKFRSKELCEGLGIPRAERRQEWVWENPVRPPGAMTEAQKAVYLSLGGGCCPHCEGGVVSREYLHDGPPDILVRVGCSVCGALWVERYCLVGVAGEIQASAWSEAANRGASAGSPRRRRRTFPDWRG